MTTVLISVVSAKVDPIIDRFRRRGWEVKLSDIGPQSTEDEVIAELMGVDATIATTEPYTRRVLESVDKLKIVARSGVGYDTIDVPAATERGIVVATTPGSNHKTVADYTVMAMLALTRKLLEAHRNVYTHRRFDRPTSHDFFGSTVGVIGTGAIGKQVIQRVSAFECTVLARDIVESPEIAALPNVTYVDLDGLLRGSDYVTVHVPSTPETRHLIGEEEMSLMRPTAFLINSARGPLVDEEAAFRAVRDKRIAGAALDVFEFEPLRPDSPLHDVEDVILTPHIAGVTVEASDRANVMAAESIVRVLSGEPPLSCVNPEVLNR
ncbi:MAG TPA: phosphoglycerate dehydrogenase [Chloroflexota bacterium]|nr:phosphoglycerate dehydrogenase [Chloroflexota bacterium]